MGLSPPSRDALLDIARAGLMERLTGRSASAPKSNDPELVQPAGCFVSLHERDTHRLRGCVGRLDMAQSLAANARATAGDVLGDPRFGDLRVTVADLPLLELEISVLSPPREAPSPLDFDL